MKRHKILGVLVVLGLIGLAVAAIVIAQQTITLTTFYPVPYGEYVDLLLTGRLDAQAPIIPIPAVSNPNQGRIFYEGPPTNKFRVSENGAPYTDLAGGGPWTRIGTSVTLTTPTDNVGIGVLPGALEKLQVSGLSTFDGNTQLRGPVSITGPGGVGTALLELQGTAGFTTEEIKLQNTITNLKWRLRHFPGNDFSISHENAVGFTDVPLIIEFGAPTGSLTIKSDGSITSWGAGPDLCCPDYVFEPGYRLESIEEHSNFMWENKSLKTIPKPEADEEGNKTIDILRTQMGILEELEKAHIYIEQLHKRLKVLEEKLATQDEKEGP